MTNSELIFRLIEMLLEEKEKAMKTTNKQDNNNHEFINNT